MKYRHKFVSNSSSSSFILSTKKENTELKMTLKIEVDIESLLSYEYNKVTTEANLHANFKERSYGDNYIESEEFLNALAEIKKGNMILFGRVASDDGDPISQYLYANGLPKKMKGYKLISEG